MHPLNLDDLDHALRNPLMIVRGRVALLRRSLAHEPSLTATEIGNVTRDLAAIDAAVMQIVAILDGLPRPDAARQPPREDP